VNPDRWLPSRPLQAAARAAMAFGRKQTFFPHCSNCFPDYEILGLSMPQKLHHMGKNHFAIRNPLLSACFDWLFSNVLYKT